MARTRRPRYVELPEYLSACRRMLRAAGRRTADADPEDVAALVALRAELDGVIAEAVAGVRASGRSWNDVATALGCTRQAAQQRYGARAERTAAVIPGQTTIDEVTA